MDVEDFGLAGGALAVNELLSWDLTWGAGTLEADWVRGLGSGAVEAALELLTGTEVEDFAFGAFKLAA